MDHIIKIRRQHRLFWVILFGLLTGGLFLASVYVVTWIPQIGTRITLPIYLPGTNKALWLISTEEITGNPFRGITFRGLKLSRPLGGRIRTAFRAEQLTLHYRLRTLLKPVPVIDSLVVIRPLVNLAVLTASTNDSKPEGKGEPSAGLREIPDIALQKVRVEQGTLRLVDDPFETRWFDAIDADLTVGKDGAKLWTVIRSLKFNIPGEGIVLRELSGQIESDLHTARIDTLQVNTGHSAISIAGTVDSLDSDPVFNLRVFTNPCHMSEIDSLVGLGNALLGDLVARGTWIGHYNHFHGDAVITGRFMICDLDSVNFHYRFTHGVLNADRYVGTAFGAAMDGTAEVQFLARPEKYTTTVRVTKLDANKIVTLPFPTEFTGQVVMQGAGFSEKTLRMGLECRLGPSSLERFPCDSANGNVLITLDSLRVEPGFKAYYRTTQIEAGGKVDFRGTLAFDAKYRIGDIREYRSILGIDSLAGSVTGTGIVEGAIAHPDLIGGLQSRDMWIYGVHANNLTTRVDLRDFLFNRRGSVYLSAGPVRPYFLPFDTLRAELALRGDTVLIENVTAGSDTVGFQGSGLLRPLGDSTTLSLFPFQFRYGEIPTQSAESLKLSFIGRDVHMLPTKLSILGGTAGFQGAWPYRESIAVWGGLNDLKVPQVLGTFFPSVKGEGRLTGDFRFMVDTTFREPLLRLSLNAVAPELMGIPLKDFSVHLDFVPGLVDLSRAEIHQGNANYTAAGTIPFDLFHLTGTPKSNYVLRLFGFGVDMDFVPKFIPDIQFIHGPFELDFLVEGSLEKPEFTGQVRFPPEGAVTPGSIKLVDLKDSISDVRCELSLIQNRVFVDTFSGTMVQRPEFSLWDRLFFWQGKPTVGHLGLTGFFDILDLTHYDFRLHLDGTNIPFRYRNTISVVADASLDLTGRDPLLITGPAIVHQGNLYNFFGEDTLRRFIRQSQGVSLPYYVDLDLSLPNNLWIHQGVIRGSEDELASGRFFQGRLDAEISGKARLIIEEGREGSSGRSQFLGSLDLLRGSYSLYGMDFKLDQGTITFDEINTIDPTVNITAHTYMQALQVNLSITGTLLDPRLEFTSSDSKFSQEDLLLFLASAKSPEDTLRSSDAGYFGNRFLQAFTGMVNTELSLLARGALGVETFELNSDPNSVLDLATTRFTVGKYLTNRFYVSYTSPLDPGLIQGLGEVTVEYRFSRDLSLQGRRDENNLHHLGLNWRWEK